MPKHIAMETPFDPAVNRIPIREFRELGYLQEANRLFFHPLGLALEVLIHEDGEETLGGVWDYRGDPDGMAYGDGLIRPAVAVRIAAEFAEKAESRRERLGWAVQPLDGGLEPRISVATVPLLSEGRDEDGEPFLPPAYPGVPES